MGLFFILGNMDRALLEITKLSEQPTTSGGTEPALKLIDSE